MINKIIDGVDVSGCEHFCRADCCSAFFLENAEDLCSCEGQECNYKRLIRLEQENERLQAENEELKKEIWKLQHREMWNKEATLQAELLIKENEELKKEIKKRKRNWKEYVHYLACMTEQRNKLKLALEEIREINKKWLSRWLNDPDERYGFEEIKSKINEVLKDGVEQ